MNKCAACRPCGRLNSISVVVRKIYYTSLATFIALIHAMDWKTDFCGRSACAKINKD